MTADPKRNAAACCRRASAPRRWARFPARGSSPRTRRARSTGRRFKGEKIEVFLVKSPRGDLLTKYHKEFEDMTGITVGSEMIPEQQQRQKAVIEFNSGNTSFDVIAISYHVQKRLFGKNKWMEDVRPLLADKSLTDPNLDFADFSKGGMAWATQADGRVDSLPFNIDPWVDLLQQGAASTRRASRTRRAFPEIVDAAAKLNDPAKGMSGFVGARPQERQRAGLVELPARLRRHLRRRQAAS